MIKKRLFICLLLLCVCATACVGLAGCGDKNTDTHNLIKHEAVDSTCTSEGNIEYYSCSHCDKLFADENGEKTLANVIVSKKAHTIADDAYTAPVLPECEKDGTLGYWECSVCRGKFINQAGTKELESIVDPAAHVFAKHEPVLPTFTEEGCKAFYKCDECGKEFLDKEAKTAATAENMKIDSLGEETVNVSVTTKDVAGEAVSDGNLTVRLILQNAAFDKVYDSIDVKDGQLDLHAIGAGEYKAVVSNNNLYYESQLTVKKGAETATLDFVKTAHTVTQCDTIAVKNDNGEEFVFTAPWENGINTPSVLLHDSAIKGKNYLVDFKVNTANWAHYTCRIGIAVAEANGNYSGFIIYTSGTATEAGYLGSDFNLNVGTTHPVFTDGMGQSVNTALSKTGELRMRAVRDGGKAYLYVFVNNAWTLLLESAVSDDFGAAVGFGIRMGADTVGTATVSDISYGEYKEQVITNEKTTLAHFVSGGRYYTSAGVATSKDKLEVFPLENVVLTLKTQNNASLAGKKVTLTNDVIKASIACTVAEGNIVTLPTIYAETYSLQVEGYILTYDVEIARSCEVSIAGESNAYTYGKKEDLSVGMYGGKLYEQRGCTADTSTGTSIVVKSLWPTSNEVTVNTGAGLDGVTDFVMQFHVAASNFNSYTTHIGIRMAEGATAHDIVGVWYAWQLSGGNHIFFVDDLYHSEGMNYYYTLAQKGTLGKNRLINTVTQQMLTNGVDMRVVRMGGKVTMLMKIGGTWAELYTTTLTDPDAEAKIGFCFSGGGQYNNSAPESSTYCTHTITDFKINALETVTPLESATLTIKTKNDVSLTGKDVTLSRRGETVTATVGENNTVELGNIYPLKYKLQVEGYIYAYDVKIARSCEVRIRVERNAYTYGKTEDLSVKQYLGGYAQDYMCDITQSDASKIVAVAQFPSDKEIGINTGAALTGVTNFVMQFNVSAENLSNAISSFGIRVAAGTELYPGEYKQESAGTADHANDTVGLVCTWRELAKNGVGIQPFYNWLKRDKPLYAQQSSWLKEYHNAITAEMVKNGIDVRVVRLDGKVTISFKINEEWQDGATVMLSNANAATEIGFYISGGGSSPNFATYTFTNLNIIALE